MNINSITAYNPNSFKGKNKNAKRAAAALTALLITQPIANTQAHAQYVSPQTSYAYSAPLGSSISAFTRLYALYGDEFEIEPQYNSKIGAYFTYAGKSFDLEGNEIKVPNDSYDFVFDNNYNQYRSDYERLYAIYGDSYSLEINYDPYIGKYYTYAGQCFDTEGNIIKDPSSKQSQTSQQITNQIYSNLTDFQKIYAIYGDDYEIEEHYDKNYGTYYKYAGNYYAPDGSKITNYRLLRDDKKPTNQNTTPQTRVTDLMRRIALFKGSGYEVEEHYDKTYGRYYTFAGKIYDIYGNEIGNVKNFQINNQKTTTPTTKPTTTTNKNSYTTTNNTGTTQVDSRAPKGSDFYYAILTYGDKYKIKSHYDPGKYGIGVYYQYGPMAFDKNGNQITNTKTLYGFDSNIK